MVLANSGSAMSLTPPHDDDASDEEELALMFAAQATRNGVPQRTGAEQHKVSRAKLWRYLHGRIMKPRRRGRPQKLFPEEEKRIARSVIEFAERGFPPTHAELAKFVLFYVNGLCPKRRTEINFDVDGPSYGWICRFRERNGITSHRRQSLEANRAENMSPTSLAEHFARLKVLCEKYKITCSSQVFNTDESAVSTRARCNGKGVVLSSKGACTQCIELPWRGNASRVTIMPVVSADGRDWNPVIVIPGKRVPYRRVRGNRVVTVKDYLPAGSYVYVREVPGVDSEIFTDWSKKFVEETAKLRQEFGYILLTLDGYLGHLSLPALQHMADNNVIVVALPAHTSHRTQVLDVSCFGPMKLALKDLFHSRSLATSQTPYARNDIYTLAELIKIAYRKSMTPRNICSGFSSTGVWTDTGVNPCVIRKDDFTLHGQYYSEEYSALDDYKGLCDYFIATKEEMLSDGYVYDRGNLTVTAGGATLTGKDVLKKLQRRAESRQADAQAKEDRAREAAKKKEVKAIKESELKERKRVRLRAADDKEEAELQPLADVRTAKAAVLAATRDSRRERRR